MQYLMVEWIHELKDEPYVIFAEIDQNMYEVRKLELFRNGNVGFATKFSEYGGSILANHPYPSLGEIASNPEFNLKTIFKEEFEKVWNRYTLDKK